jgi:hypothetical protein
MYFHPCRIEFSLVCYLDPFLEEIPEVRMQGDMEVLLPGVQNVPPA